MFNLLKQQRLYFSLTALVIFFAIGFNFWFSKTAGFLLFNKFHSIWLDKFFTYFTFLGDGVFLIAIVILLLLVKKTKAAIALLISFLSSGLMAQLLKRFFQYPRPKLYFQEISFNYLHYVKEVTLYNSNSFPSGHTTTAFATATVLALVFKNNKIAIPCLILAALVGYSRIYLAQHFLQDVIMGAILGTFFGLLSYYLVNKQFNKTQPNLLP